MARQKSEAFSGVGTKFYRAGGASSAPAFERISEITSIDGPNKSRGTIDVTSLDSEDGYNEFITSFRDAGEVALGMNFTPDGYNLLNTDFESEDAVLYKIILGNKRATQFEFDAYVTNLGSAISAGDKVSASVTIKITGPVRFDPDGASGSGV